ncbi:MAG: SDR family oxidoreductase [Verrucomicrobiales bacterium]|jgi:NAD(P)-dependent dehydrogenase (short-subunit alcohol dehydrogenase family)|nr:SDR family oxidoreductase [Verrucomicrobiales bacterium]
MIPLNLNQQTVLITGALGALGKFLIRRLSEAGATLILTDILPQNEALQRLTDWSLASEKIRYHQLDITDPQAVDVTVGDIFKNHPGVNTVIGHAGGCLLHPFATCSATDYHRVFDFNFFGQTYLARAVLVRWQQHKTAGHLIFTSSYVAQIPHKGIPAYAPAKAALENFAKCLALEYANDGIRVNLIAPGNVAAGSSLLVYEQDTEYRNFVRRVTPNGQRNTPEAIANAFVFLCSPLANEFNGQILHVDNGLSIPKIG